MMPSEAQQQFLSRFNKCLFNSPCKKKCLALLGLKPQTIKHSFDPQHRKELKKRKFDRDYYELYENEDDLSFIMISHSYALSARGEWTVVQSESKLFGHCSVNSQAILRTCATILMIDLTTLNSPENSREYFKSWTI